MERSHRELSIDELVAIRRDIFERNQITQFLSFTFIRKKKNRYETSVRNLEYCWDEFISWRTYKCIWYSLISADGEHLARGWWQNDSGRWLGHIGALIPRLQQTQTAFRASRKKILYFTVISM